MRSRKVRQIGKRCRKKIRGFFFFCILSLLFVLGLTVLKKSMHSIKRSMRAVKDSAIESELMLTKDGEERDGQSLQEKAKSSIQGEGKRSIQKGSEIRKWESLKSRETIWIQISTREKRLGCVSENGMASSLPLELYVECELASCMSGESEIEALKAQAIVLRSNACYGFEHGRNSEDFHDSTNSATSLTKETQREEIVKAVSETKGIVLAQKGEVIYVPFHAMSVGHTRILDSVEASIKPYLKSVSCNEVVYESDYLHSVYCTSAQFQKPENCERDEYGYITKVSIEQQEMTGEEFREKYDLASSNITWRKFGTGYVLTSRGIGHGIGFDERYGNYLARQGYSAMEILNYFFQDVQYIKY